MGMMLWPSRMKDPYSCWKESEMTDNQIPDFDAHIESEIQRIKERDEKLRKESGERREVRLINLRNAIARKAELTSLDSERRFQVDIPDACEDDEIELITSELIDAGWGCTVTTEKMNLHYRYRYPETGRGYYRTLHYGSKEAIDAYIATREESVSQQAE